VEASKGCITKATLQASRHNVKKTLYGPSVMSLKWVVSFLPIRVVPRAILVPFARVALLYYKEESIMRYKILEILEKNSKATPKQIAGMLGLNESMVAEEIISMENERIILQYGAIINWEKASNKDMVIALIDVKVTPQRDVGFDQLAAKIYKYPEVREIFLMSGSYDFSVQVVGKNLKEIADFVGKKLAIIDGVQSTTTHFVLKKYKVAHVILEDDEKDRRQVITP